MRWWQMTGRTSRACPWKKHLDILDIMARQGRKAGSGADPAFCGEPVLGLVVGNPLPAMSFLRTWGEKKWIKAL